MSFWIYGDCFPNSVSSSFEAMSLFSITGDPSHPWRGEPGKKQAICHSTPDIVQPWQSAVHELQGRSSQTKVLAKSNDIDQALCGQCPDVVE